MAVLKVGVCANEGVVTASAANARTAGKARALERPRAPSQPEWGVVFGIHSSGRFRFLGVGFAATYAASGQNVPSRGGISGEGRAARWKTSTRAAMTRAPKIEWKKQARRGETGRKAGTITHHSCQPVAQTRGDKRAVYCDDGSDLGSFGSAQPRSQQTRASSPGPSPSIMTGMVLFSVDRSPANQGRPKAELRPPAQTTRPIAEQPGRRWPGP